jgi:hypothetical protein
VASRTTAAHKSRIGVSRDGSGSRAPDGVRLLLGQKLTHSSGRKEPDI